jgi:hypothetical protein
MTARPASRQAALALALAGLVAHGAIVPVAQAADPPHIMWLNHFSLLSGDPSVTSTSANSTSSEVGGGLTALVVESSTLGDVDSFGGIKVVHMALDLPPSTRIDAVRVCYELTSSASFVSQVRLAQVQNPPGAASIRLDDGTDLTDPGPVCMDTAAVAPPVRGKDGSVLLSLRVNFGNTSDKIAIRALGLLVH